MLNAVEFSLIDNKMKGAAHSEGNVDAVCDDAVDDETDNDGTCVNVGVSLVVHKSLLVPKIAKKRILVEN